MATPREVRKARAGKKPRAKGNNEKPPVKDYWQLLDYRTYLRNSKRWVTLCVVKGSNGVELKLYDWMWRGEKKGWKVAWANTNVASLNLNRIAHDSRELAAEYDIHLRWA